MKWFFVCLGMLAGGSVFPQETGSVYAALKPSVAVHEIVGLGESSHGFGTYNEAKAGLIEAMHGDDESLSVIFESPFTAGVVAYLERLDAPARLAASVYAFWNTPSVLRGVEPFLRTERNTGRPQVWGCDMQEDCRFGQLSAYLLRGGMIRTEARTLQRCDSVLATVIGPRPSLKYLDDAGRDTLINGYGRVIKELDGREIDALERKLLHQALLNRKWLCEYLCIKDMDRRMAFRDGLMSRNVVWIYENFLKGNGKAVLWAADTHIGKNDEAVKMGRPRWTGEHLQVYFKEKYYAVSLAPGKADGLKPGGKRFDAVLYFRNPEPILPGQWETPCP